jgi:hypothetical protein
LIGDQPGATQSTGRLDAWMSSPSAYAVAAANTADVVAAIKFGRENRLRLVVKVYPPDANSLAEATGSYTNRRRQSGVASLSHAIASLEAGKS